jgi:hypothetical protein
MTFNTPKIRALRKRDEKESYVFQLKFCRPEETENVHIVAANLELMAPCLVV